MDDPDMGEWSYAYDTLGNLTQQTDARGCITTLSYDQINRLTGKTYTNCPTTAPVTYGYDAGTYGWGKRTSMSDGSGSTTWNYDARGQVITETRTITGSLGTFVTAWGYNSAGQVDWMRYPQDNQGNPGERVDYSYNNQLALDSETGITGTQVNTYVLGTSYDVAGRVVQRILGQNTIFNRYQYYPWNEQGSGRLRQLTSGIDGNLTSLQDLSYTYDNIGNMLTILDNRAPDGPQTQSFTYDALYRLLNATVTPMGSAGAYQENYSYAPDTGNLLTKGGIAYFYTDARHAHAVTSRSNGESFQYDSNGNMTQRTINGRTYNMVYDAENRLVQVSGAATVSYWYDGDGQRVLVTNGANTTIYVGNHFEWGVEQSTAVQYYYAGAVRVAMRRAGNSLLWLLNDHLDSTSAAANSDGTLHSLQYYTAWGEKRYPQGASNLSTTYRYTGQLEDSYTGLYWFGSRWYDPQLGRFIQADPLIPEFTQGAQAWDRYAFVNNNPLKFIDRNGHDAGCSAANPVCRGLSGYPTTPPPYRETKTAPPELTFRPPAPPVETICKLPEPVETTWNAAPTSVATIGPNPVTDDLISLSAPTKATIAVTVSHATSVAPVVFKGLEGASFNPYLSSIGSLASGVAQWESDSDLDLSTGQRIGRSFIYAGESVFISITSANFGYATGLGAAGLGGPTVIGVPVAGVGGFLIGYSSMSIFLSNIVEDYNDQWLFPVLGLDPIPQ